MAHQEIFVFFTTVTNLHVFGLTIFSWVRRKTMPLIERRRVVCLIIEATNIGLGRSRSCWPAEIGMDFDYIQSVLHVVLAAPPLFLQKRRFV